MPSDHSLTVAEREAELAALQSAFDEYITSSRELEEELDAELVKMQEKLTQSTAANTELSLQLETLSPQLTALEEAHAATKDKFVKEQKLRRQAEMAQEDAEAKCREIEASLSALRAECDAAHEELAFKDSELEETRLELEVERERHREEVEELRLEIEVQQQERQENGDAADDSVVENGKEPEPTLEEEMGDKDYVKRLEDELELVTEQLIDTEQKLTKAEDLLAEERDRNEALLKEQETKSEKGVDESALLELREANDLLVENEQKLKEEVELLNEELSLTQEELRAAEEDSKQFEAKLDGLRSTHRDEMNALNKRLETASTDAKTYAAELQTLEKTLEETSAETVSLTREVENLQVALDNAKQDHAAVVQELEDVNQRFDSVRKEAEKRGRDAGAEEVRAELTASHKAAAEEMTQKYKELEATNAALQKSVDEMETSLAAERDKQAGQDANAPTELELKLKDQLTRTQSELEKRTQAMEELKSVFESRVSKTEEDVTRLEKELSTTKGKLAEAEANLIVIRRERERDSSAREASNESTPRSRSSGGDTPNGDSNALQEQYDSLKDQNRMNECHIKKLEEELKVLQTQILSSNGDAAIPTQMSRISALAANASEDQMEDVATDAVEQIIQSRDPKRITEELRKLDKKSTQQREHNAQLLSKILSLQGNIQVCCRVRPLRLAEIQQGNKSVVESFSETEVGCFDARANKWKSFGFDKVWGPDQSQHDVFQDVEPLALSVVDGYNACIFAYGQTGSGKTYTMEGTPEGSQYGISYRTIQKIFHLLNLRQQQQMAAKALGRDDGDALPFKFSLQVGMLEIYNDEVYDLLSPAAAGALKAADKKREARMAGEKATLDIRRSAEGQIEVPGLTKESVTSIQDVMDLLKRGNSCRATASTNLNEHSSRSHMVLLVDVTSGLEGQPSNKGCLYLVDLAGSERVRRSQVEGDQLKEAGFINKSLSALGNVMEALDRKASHVPYRDSKLTYLLQDSLGGNSRTMMVVAVCPMDTAYDESVHALQFATRVRRIQLGAAQRNVTSKNLEETVKALTSEMKMLTKAKEKSEHQLSSLKRDNTRIQDRLHKISESRAKSQSDSRTLDVLRKNNQEMATRWQKEKHLREKSTTELEKTQLDLQRSQKQLIVATRERDSLKRKLAAKETELKQSTEDLRRAKDASSAANLRARTAQVMSHRKATNGTARTPARDPSSTPSSSVASPPADPAEVRKKVLELLEKYDKAKVDRIDIIMEKFKGKEKLLLEKMTQRYEGSGAVSASLQQRSEMALARHKERMQKRKDAQ